MVATSQCYSNTHGTFVRHSGVAKAFQLHSPASKRIPIWGTYLELICPHLDVFEAHLEHIWMNLQGLGMHLDAVGRISTHWECIWPRVERFWTNLERIWTHLECIWKAFDAWHTFGKHVDAFGTYLPKDTRILGHIKVP